MEKNELLLIYDDRCRFCTFCRGVLGRLIPSGLIGFIPLSSLDNPENGVVPLRGYSREALSAALHVVYDGSVSSGWDALMKIANCMRMTRWIAVAGNLPVIHSVGAFLYNLAASNRYIWGKCQGACHTSDLINR